VQWVRQVQWVRRAQPVQPRCSGDSGKPTGVGHGARSCPVTAINVSRLAQEQLDKAAALSIRAAR